MTIHFWITGDPERAVEFGQRALAIAEALGDVPLQVGSDWRLGLVYRTLGDYPRAIGHLRRAVASLENDLSYHEPFAMPRLPSVQSRNLLAGCLADRGEFGEAIDRGKEALRIAASADDHSSLVAAFDGLGSVYLRQGDFPEAIAIFERGFELAKAADVSLFVPIVASGLGSAYALSGRVAEALPVLELAAAGRGVGQALQAASLSEGYLRAGRMEGASQAAQRALALARDHKERGNEAWVLRLWGEIAAERDPPDLEKADDHYRQATALAQELGMRPLVAHCHLGLGRLYSRAGQHEQAREHLTTATTMYREMDMQFWRDQAEAAQMKELA
jgi:tetratricopeptide (TPR) repeat protein